MSKQPQGNWLDDALRQEAPHIDDAGFTARVVATLPRRRKRAWLRSAILLGMTVLGCVIALVILPGAQFVADSIGKLVTARALSPALLAPLVLVIAVFGTAIAAVAGED